MTSLSPLESPTEEQDPSEHNTLEITCNSDMDNSEYSWPATPISHLDDHALEDPPESHTVNLSIEYEDPSANREPRTPVTSIANPRLTNDCKTELVRWCASNQDLLRDRGYSMTKFYEELTAYMKVTFDRDIKHVGRVLNRLVSNHRKYQAALLTDSGVVRSETDLTQALDVWVEFIDDLKDLKAQRAKEENEKQAHQRAIAKQQQADLMTRQSARKRSWNEDNSSENGDLDEGTEAEEEDSPSTHKKQLKNPQLREIALLNEGLKSALSSFGFDIKKAASISASSAAENVFKRQKREVREELDQMEGRLSGKFDEMLELLRGREKEQ